MMDDLFSLIEQLVMEDLGNDIVKVELPKEPGEPWQRSIGYIRKGTGEMEYSAFYNHTNYQWHIANVENFPKANLLNIVKTQEEAEKYIMGLMTNENKRATIHREHKAMQGAI
jgi:hypothetical protein